jgi:hypothetical protein
LPKAHSGSFHVAANACAFFVEDGVELGEPKGESGSDSSEKISRTYWASISRAAQRAKDRTFSQTDAIGKRARTARVTDLHEEDVLVAAPDRLEKIGV